MSDHANTSNPLVERVCPHCHETVTVSSDRLGRIILCPACGELVTLPANGEPALTPEPAATLAREQDGAAAPTGEPDRDAPIGQPAPGVREGLSPGQRQRRPVRLLPTTLFVIWLLLVASALLIVVAEMRPLALGLGLASIGVFLPLARESSAAEGTLQGRSIARLRQSLDDADLTTFTACRDAIGRAQRLRSALEKSLATDLCWRIVCSFFGKRPARRAAENRERRLELLETPPFLDDEGHLVLDSSYYLDPLEASRMGITVHGTVRLVLHESGDVTLHLGGRSAAVSEAVNRHLPERWYVYKEGSQWCLRETRDDGSTEFIRASGEITFDPTRPIEQISAPLNPRQRRAIPDRIKVFVWQRDGGKCVQCGSTEKLEYDHIIPLSRGGSNSARNIQLLCQDCNRRKGNSIT